MEDITVLSMGRASDSAANKHHRSVSRAAQTKPANTDELVAGILIASWSRATGRTLRAGVPRQWLTEDELISFWADDHIAP